MPEIIIPTTTRPNPHLVVTIEPPVIAAPGVMPRVHLTVHGMNPIEAAWAMGKAIECVLNPNSQAMPAEAGVGIVGP